MTAVAAPQGTGRAPVVHRRARWLPAALATARRWGVADDVADRVHALATGAATGSIYFAARDRVTTRVGHVEVVLSADDVVLAVTDRTPRPSRPHQPRRAPATPPRVKQTPPPRRQVKGRGGRAMRGPRTWDELREWLTDEGYTVVHVQSGHYGVFDKAGARVGSMPASASDWRSLANAASDFKRRTGVVLRRPMT